MAVPSGASPTLTAPSRPRFTWPGATSRSFCSKFAQMWLASVAGTSSWSTARNTWRPEAVMITTCVVELVSSREMAYRVPSATRRRALPIVMTIFLVTMAGSSLSSSL